MAVTGNSKSQTIQRVIAMKTMFLATIVVMIMQAPSASAVEVISAQTLAGHCESFPGESVGARKCETYVQGFVDGAVATDVRVMLNVEAEQRKETLTERAFRTRIGASTLRRAAGYAEFCLGDPVPLQEVVTNVADDLKARADKLQASTAARDVVYASLRRHYPCAS